ncbi:hypothetical protein CS8_045210 [Cupriavidus sp. 8B]
MTEFWLTGSANGPSDAIPATPRFLYVGSEWDELAPAAEWTGMRDPFIEAMTAESPCEPQIMVTAGGRTLWRRPLIGLPELGAIAAA